MRIGISGFFWNKPATGSGQYVTNLVRHLRPTTQDEIIVFVPGQNGSPSGADLEVGNGGPKEAAMVEVALPWGGNLGKVWFEQVALPRACRRYGVELLHVPYLGPPLRKVCPMVVTIHDLIMMVLPVHRGSLLVRLYTALAVSAAKRAELVLADSQWTRADVTRLLGLPQERVPVVYLGVGPAPNVDHITARLPDVRQKYRLEENFILYLGGLDWRKNVASLIGAFSHLEGEWQLAVAGEHYMGKGRLFPNLFQVAREAGVEERVRFLGFVPEEDKVPLYIMARLFVYPSLYEGFGLPPLEAMACGTPVVCSQAASLSEVVGDGALRFPPQNEAALAQAMARALTDDVLRRELKERGLRQVQKFNWQRTAQETWSAYQQVVKKDAPWKSQEGPI
ncbi:MAG: glycosyltransferase family 4 protein [Chloroflexi bacterium]|nr:glycosyltransferase family 4 protein [Chloroflexota bacterium]